MSHLTLSPHPFLIALFQHLWQTTLFTLALAALAMLLRGNRAALRFRIWMLASVKFLLPLSLLISAGQHLRPAKLQAVAPVGFTLVMQGAPDEPALDASDLRTTPKTQSHVQAPHDVTSLLLIPWVCGALAVLAVWTRRWSGLQRAVRRGNSAGVHQGVRVVRVAARFEPGVFGILRPVLVLPHGLEAALSPTELSAVLAHEISHVRRRDNLTAAIHMLVQTLFWFHPLVWVIGQKMLAEREAACDAAVLAQRIDAQDYAAGILKVCRLYLEAPLPCVAGVTGADLKQRILSIAMGDVGRRLSLARATGLAVLGIGAVSAPIAFGVLHAAVLHSTERHPSAAAVLHATLTPDMPATPTPRLRLPSTPPPPPAPPLPPLPPDPIATSMPATHPMTTVQIQASNPYMPGTGFGFEQSTDLTHTRFRAMNKTLADLISFAYGVQAKQIIDGPRWIDTERYDITANVASPQIQPEQIQAMMRRLLADHFGIRVHPARRDLQVYVLTVSQAGHHLRQDETNPHGLPRLGLIAAGSLAASNASMRDLCNSLASYAIDRPMVDRTGLSGRWYFDLQWHPDAAFFAALKMPEPRNLADDKSPPLLTAIRQQLGLNVEPTTLPINVLVLDRASRPRAN